MLAIHSELNVQTELFQSHQLLFSSILKQVHSSGHQKLVLENMISTHSFYFYFLLEV